MSSSVDDQPSERQQLAILRQDHRELDLRIEELAANLKINQLEVSRLKKRKLRLKDLIIRLESKLIPDLLA